MHMCDPPRIYPSLSDYTLFFNNYMRPSLPEAIPPTRIYPPLFFNNYDIMRPSQNLPLLPRIYPLFNKCTCATLPESTPPSQTIPCFLTTICDPPSQKLSLPPEYTPPLFFNNYDIMRPSQNLPLSPRIYPSFQQLHATIPESTPPSQNIPPFQQMHMCDPPRIYPSLSNYTLFFNNYMRPSLPEAIPPSQNAPPPFQQLYATLPESTPPSWDIPPFSTTTILCEPPRIYPSLPEYTPFSTTIILCDDPRIYPSVPEYTPFSTNAHVRPSQNLPLPLRLYPVF